MKDYKFSILVLLLPSLKKVLFILIIHLLIAFITTNDVLKSLSPNAPALGTVSRLLSVSVKWEYLFYKAVMRIR